MSHRILILGGTGGTGRKIVRALQQLMPEATIHTGGRSYPLQPVGYGVEHVNIDVCRNDQEQEKTLSGYDLVILSLGPFTTLQTRAHELCIRAGVDCLDVNDCPLAARKIFKLADAASAANVRILTGMGLNPGMSTALIHLLAGISGGPISEAHVRLFAGRNEPAGPAATETMIHGLRLQACELADGREILVPALDKSNLEQETFPTLGNPVSAVQCFSAEAALLEEEQARGELSPVVGRITYRMHCEGMPLWIAGLLRAFPAEKYPAFTSFLTRLFYRLHEKGGGSASGLSRSILLVRAQGASGSLYSFATGESTFGMTGAFAAAVASEHLKANAAIAPGVYSISQRFPWIKNLPSSLEKLRLSLGYFKQEAL